MKNKKILTVIMLFLIGICCISTNSYAVCPAIYGGCSWSSATCTKLSTCSRCGDTRGGYASHSYGGYSVTRWETCTEDGWEVAYCSCGASTGRSRAATGHDMGAWYSISGYQHRRDCDNSGCDYNEKQNCNQNNKIDMPLDDDYHALQCSVCLYKWPFEDFQEKHPGWTAGEQPSPHQCTACNHKMAADHGSTKRRFHHYAGLSSSYVTQPAYYCVTCNNRISINNGTYAELHLDGLPEYEYVASDAKYTMKTIPQLPNGTYTLEWKSDDVNPPKLTNAAGAVVTPQINPADVAIEAWSRKNLKTHAQKTKDYAKEAYDSQTALHDSVSVIEGPYLVVPEEKGGLYAVYDMIDSCINRASVNPKLQWNNPLNDAAKAIYRDGETYEPTITQASTTVYNLQFNHPNGGWIVPPNMFNSSITLLDSLFQLGEVEKEPKQIWTANIYYCYRVLNKGTVPKNGYVSIYKYAEVTVYDAGPIDVPFKISADMGLIDRTGYRYVGVTTQVGAVGSLKPASAPTSTLPYGAGTVGWDADRAAAIVTFFVEPVLCSWNQYAVNYNGDTLKLSTASHEGSGLEFPDYFDGTRCYIPLSTGPYSSTEVEPLESLHKYYWPGYILRKSGVYPEGSSVNASPVAGSSVKTYNDAQTTKIDGSSPGYVINERIPSYYEEEPDGYAVDKNFRFFYNTPTIDIEHKKYGTNEYMTTVDGKDIKYKQQIVNQYAYVDSLITDNIKNENYVLSVSTATGNIETFEYKYPRYDLVQVKIYEITDGSQKHYGTLYVDKDYKEGSKSYLVEGYQGIFAKYYSESLKAIANQIKQSTTAFNTNKNWKIEFIYDEVERVYIQFKDLRGNSIFIKDEANPGRYIGELTAKVPRTTPFTYTPVDLGENGRFKLVQYTRRPDAFVKDYKEDLKDAMEISSGTTVSVAPNQGYDTYIIFYYLTGEMITVEYRDLNENEIKDPETFEIPITGINLDVPEINLYEIEGYKHNPDYDPITDPNNIPGETKKTLPTGEEVFVIDGILRPLTEEDKVIGIPNPEEKSHHVIIYYDSKEALKIEYRDTENNPIPVPPQYVTEEWLTIPEKGVDVVVPTVPGYEVKEYQHNPNYNGTDTTIDSPAKPTDEGLKIDVDSNGNNQYIIIYYEKEMMDPIDLTIKFVPEDPEDPDGKPDMDEPLKDPVTIEIPKGEDVPVPVPEIEEYTPVSYIEGEPPIDPIPKPEPLVGEPIVSGDGPIEVILIYRPNNPEPIEPDPEVPTIITPDDNLENAYLRANRKGTEEYETEVAIPTSEDLYVSGDVYDYRMVTDIETIGEEHTINVEIWQPYYTMIGDKEVSSTLAYIKLPIDNVKLVYNYFKINKAELYDLKAIKVENGAIKFYDNYDIATDTAGHYIEGEANYKPNKIQPHFEYNMPEKEADANNDAVRIQINSTTAYTVEKSGGKFIIKINDVDYYDGTKIAAGAYKEEVMNQLKKEAEAIIEKCTQIKVPKLTVNLPNKDGTGEHVLDILTGEKYYMPNKSEVLNSTDYYVPYVAGRAPLYSFYHDKDLYVREEAENRYYGSTIAGDYRLIEAIINDEPVPADGKKLAVEKITVNPLNVHTPIINKVELLPSQTNNDSIQLENLDYAKPYGFYRVGKLDGTYEDIIPNPIILNLEEKFVIKIPNDGKHISSRGYSDGVGYSEGKPYNHGGLTANMDSEPENDATPALNDGKSSRIEPKSDNNFMPQGIITHNGEDWIVDTTKIDNEQYAVGPSFAEYKLIKFPYDVYLIGASKCEENTGSNIVYSQENVIGATPHLFKANVWYNLYSYVRPSEDAYIFAIPTWVKDAKEYYVTNGIQVLVVAENCSIKNLEAALKNPLEVKSVANNKENKNTTYILRKTFDTYISGRLYDLQIRDTDDPGFMGKLKNVLKGEADPSVFAELPLAQSGQVPAYKMGLKLGYRFYFDLKTKGVSNKDVLIRPNIYYVPTNVSNSDQVLSLADGEFSMFYHTKGNLYNKLTQNDLNIKMTMAGTHGIVNNPGYTQETIAASQLVPGRNFRNTVIIGKIVDGLKMNRDTQKLPYNNLLEVARVCGFMGTDAEAISGLLTSAINEAKTYETLITNENMIKNATGHWYGEFYLPATTYVYAGNVERDAIIKGTAKSSELKTGYLVVVFEEIKTEDDVRDETSEQPGYLTYSAPVKEKDDGTKSYDTMQWNQEGIETQIILPNGVPVNIKTNNNPATEYAAGAMAIYQVGLRANNDFEVEGTH